MNKILCTGVGLTACLLFCTCDRQNVASNSEIEFEEDFDLMADSIKVNELISFGNIYRVGDRIVLFDRQNSPEYQCYVYSADMKLQYAFCKHGDGPNEYLMPTVVKNTPDSLFQFRDHFKDVFVSYILTDSGAVVKEEYPLANSDGMFDWEMNYVSPCEYLVRSTSARKSRRVLKNIAADMVLDSLANPFPLEKQMGADYYCEFDECWLSVENNSFATAYYFMDRIEIGHISNGKLEVDVRIGASAPPKFHKYTSAKLNGKFSNNVDYNMVYYDGLDLSGRRIYASFAGVEWGDIDKPRQSMIHVFDLKGRPLAKLRLDKCVTSFIVLENRLYAISNVESDDYLYIYNLPKSVAVN